VGETMSKQEILLAEDHTILREGIRALLSGNPDLVIVGEAGDGREAIQRSQELQPHVILMDLSMPNINGTEAIRAIKQRNPSIKIIVLTVHKSEEYVRATLEAGADGYVLKDDSQQDLMAAFASVQKGRVYLSSGICDKVIDGYLSRSTSAQPVRSWDLLTVRERQVLKLVAEGKKNREIATYLSISLKTVEKHRTSLMKRLGIHNVSALTMFAIDNGLVNR
jgi:two-component system response regulator NreC